MEKQKFVKTDVMVVSLAVFKLGLFLLVLIGCVEWVWKRTITEKKEKQPSPHRKVFYDYGAVYGAKSNSYFVVTNKADGSASQ